MVQSEEQHDSKLCHRSCSMMSDPVLCSDPVVRIFGVLGSTVFNWATFIVMDDISNFFVLLLLLSGDVEMNPGPGTKHVAHV